MLLGPFRTDEQEAGELIALGKRIGQVDAFRAGLAQAAKELPQEAPEVEVLGAGR